MDIKSYQAIIFDCDGVIVDSEPLSCGAWNIVFEREYGICIGTDYTQILGKNSRDTAIYYLKKHHLPVNDDIIKKLTILKEKVYLEIAEGKLQPIPGVQRFLKECKEKKLKLAVASSGTIEKITFNLKQVNLLEWFDALVGTNNQLRGKPHPDVFLEAARSLKIHPRKCIVLEDTPNGIVAAKKAEMFTIALTTTFPSNKLKQADAIFNTYDELMTNLFQKDPPRESKCDNN